MASFGPLFMMNTSRNRENHIFNFHCELDGRPKAGKIAVVLLVHVTKPKIVQ
jgi:hypothetical protein